MTRASRFRTRPAERARPTIDVAFSNRSQTNRYKFQSGHRVIPVDSGSFSVN